MPKRNSILHNGSPQKAPAKVEKTAFGVRFQPQFRLMDQIGRIMDEILYAKSSPFNPDVFPTISRGTKLYALENEDTGDTLTVTERDVILNRNANTVDYNDVVFLAEEFEEYVLTVLKK